VYLHKNYSEAALEHFRQIYEQPLPESNSILSLTPPNLNHQTPNDESLHPELLKASLYFQSLIRDEVSQHYRREQAARREIWPAAPPAKVDNEDDIDFCSGLACAPTGGQSTQLVW
jgi:hypothetical protein